MHFELNFEIIMKQITVYTDAGYCNNLNIGYFGSVIESDNLNILLSSSIYKVNSAQMAELEAIYNTLYFLKDLVNPKELHITLVNDNINNLQAIHKKMNKNVCVENNDFVKKIIAQLKKYKQVTILHKSKCKSHHIHMCDLMARFVKKKTRISSIGYLLQPFHEYQRVTLKNIFC